jgi:hypothetical protein
VKGQTHEWIKRGRKCWLSEVLRSCLISEALLSYWFSKVLCSCLISEALFSYWLSKVLCSSLSSEALLSGLVRSYVVA